MKIAKLSLGALLIPLALLSFVGCQNESTQIDPQPNDQASDQPGDQSGLGRLSFRMVDAPGDAAHLWVSVEQISLKSCGGEGWLDVPTVNSQFDLMTLANGDAFKTLTQAAFIPLGSYCETRLILGEVATVETEGGESYPLKVPSGESSGYKIKGEYDVRDDALTIVTLDFDAEQSLHKAGNSGKYILRPVVFLSNVTYEDLAKEIEYRDFLRTRLESRGDADVSVQVSLGNWHTVALLNELLSEAGAPACQVLHARSNILAKTLQTTIDCSPGDPLEQQVRDHFLALQSRTQRETAIAQATAIIEEGPDLTVRSISLMAEGSASEILSWWDQHPDAVRLIQLIVNPIDNSQQTFAPGEIVK